MPSIKGIEFDAEAYALINALIAEAKSWGNWDFYPLAQMHRGRGEIRFAHMPPDAKRKKAKGVFAQIYPTKAGASFIPRKRYIKGSTRKSLSEQTLPGILAVIKQTFEKTKPLIRGGSERVEPNQPGTLQGGRFESNRHKF
jgi:hypothetical protein